MFPALHPKKRRDKAASAEIRIAVIQYLLGFTELNAFVSASFMIIIKLGYSERNASTGSFFAAIFAGIDPPIKVKIILIATNNNAWIGFN